MISYRVDALALVIASNGQHWARERDLVYDAIRRDPFVPDDSLLIVDVRRRSDLHDTISVQGSVDALIDGLGPKLGPLCALLPGDGRHRQARDLQHFAARRGLRVGIFDDESSARAWLTAHRSVFQQSLAPGERGHTAYSIQGRIVTVMLADDDLAGATNALHRAVSDVRLPRRPSVVLDAQTIESEWTAAQLFEWIRQVHALIGPRLESCVVVAPRAFPAMRVETIPTPIGSLLVGIFADWATGRDWLDAPTGTS